MYATNEFGEVLIIELMSNESESGDMESALLRLSLRAIADGDRVPVRVTINMH